MKSPSYALLFAIFLLGCSYVKTHHINITEIGTYPQPLAEPLPLKVGVCYQEDFCTFHTKQTPFPSGGSGGDIAISVTISDEISLGKANIALFDYILSQTFEKVTSVQDFSEDLKNMKHIDLIIEPAVHEYSYSVSPSIGLVRLVYAVTFYTPDGKRLGAWLIEGNGSELVGIRFETETTSVTRLTQLAMRQVAAKFMVGFCNQPEIKKLFSNQCNR